MSKRVVIARTGQVVTCKACGSPGDGGQIWRGALCSDCWAGAGMEMGWVLQSGAFLFLQQMLAPHLGERGGPEDLIMALRRLLAERRLLALGQHPTESTSLHCVYCGEPGPDEAGTGGAALESLDFVPDLPDLWRCCDRQMCLQRLMRRLQGTLRPAGN